MAELPASWRLKTKRLAGKTAVVGTDAAGSEYVAAVSEVDGVDDSMLENLALHNRETTSAREVVQRQMAAQDGVKKRLEDEALESYMEPADMAVRAMLERPRLGYSRAYARNYDRAFGKDN